MFVYAIRGLVRLAFAGGLAAVLYLAAPYASRDSRAGVDTDPPTTGTPNLSGPAHIIDGDTIQISGTRIRLEGIDAPETAQHCSARSGGNWAPGIAATRYLAHLTEGQDVSCVSKGLDIYGRTLGLCYVAGREINADLVRQGLAWAFVKYSRAYVDIERDARHRRIGIWQADCQPAWAYRAERWSAVMAQTSQQAPAGCVIKGNISRAGHIYHMPWSPFYAKTRIEPERGERWFCSEAEALAAGWHPVRPHR